jgi:hypothetical protein
VEILSQLSQLLRIGSDSRVDNIGALSDYPRRGSSEIAGRFGEQQLFGVAGRQDKPRTRIDSSGSVVHGSLRFDDDHPGSAALSRSGWDLPHLRVCMMHGDLDMSEIHLSCL